MKNQIEVLSCIQRSWISQPYENKSKWSNIKQYKLKGLKRTILLMLENSKLYNQGKPI